MSATLQVHEIEELRELLPLATPEEQATVARLIEERRATYDKSSAETHLTVFVREAWKFLEPGRELTWSWHYDLLCEYLTLVRDRVIRRLILNVPPRTAKSTIATICFPCWVWTTEPKHEFLCASYSRDLSTDHSVARRNLLESPWYQERWGDKVKLSKDRNLTTQFNNENMGRMIATSTTSGVEGKGGDTAILDDPMSNQQAMSDVERLSVNKWVVHTLKQRLNNPATAAIIIIMQRLHELDTTGFVTQEEKGTWTHIVVPLVAEKEEEFVYPISKKVHVRKEGNVLQPDRFTPDVVKEKQGSRLVYAGQYQQRPAPLEGNMIKRKDVQYYGGVDPLTGLEDEQLPTAIAGGRFDKIILSVDCAFKDLDTSDYVAIGAIGLKGRKRFILDIINEHLNCSGTELAVRRMKDKWAPRAIIVEDKANGPAVIQRLQKNVTGVVEIEPQGGKVARMFAAAPEWEAGDWYVDRTAAWAEPFIQQITMFPTAAHDDMCDMMSQAAIYLGESTLELWKKLAG